MNRSKPAEEKHASFLKPFIEPALKMVRSNHPRIVCSGLWGSAKAAWVAGIADETDRPLCVLTASDAQAESFHQDLVCWFNLEERSTDDLILFPSYETLPYELTAPHPDLIRRRWQALDHLLYRGAAHTPAPPRSHGQSPMLASSRGAAAPMKGGGVIVTTSVPAVMQRVISPAALRESVISLETARSPERQPQALPGLPRGLGASEEPLHRTGPQFPITRDGLIESLTRLGYSRTGRVEYPGEFSLRGGILDIFSTACDEPLRTDWAGDQIETIRTFNPDSQISVLTLSQARILPASVPAEQCNATLMDYLSPGTRWVLDEPAVIRDHAEAFHTEVKSALSSRQTRSAIPTPLYLTPEELNRHLTSVPSMGLETIHLETSSDRDLCSLSTRSPESLGLGLKGTPLSAALKILDDLRHKARVVFIAKTSAQRDRWMDLFCEYDLPAAGWSATSFSSPPQTYSAFPFLIAVGHLSSGFIDLNNRLAVLTDEDLFGKGIKHRPPPRPKGARFLSSLDDLKEGDYIVHVQHGIGRYEGLKRLSIQGYESDFLILHYLGGDTLYIPIDRLNLVQKYSGVEGHRPKLDRLGGITWARTTQRVKKAVQTMGREILELYAAREITPGYVFSKDSVLSREFDAAFAYEETPDQFKAIEDVKQDMEQPRPMDRLICGDVGYGKTEVAMRATFKAVMDEKQVAVLVPTTLLAQQHGETFRERFSPFPVRVEILSRFRSVKEQKGVLSDLTAGKVDILIGTHRLLQKDVSFHDLGLLIVDEEQRFGVRHKEKLKQLRKTVDTLTLTATPIPRTLQMALTGIRELSIMDTPPADRLAVRTVLARLDRPVIRNAILRELSRQGQVFFVHNRVQDIERLGRFLEELVPEAKLAIAHGQMPERLLEQVMRRFVHQETNVLLTTAIIESGLDIPTANTILINEAHRFGLADLYQLRGRVGRSGHQAYAYLLVPSDQGLTEEARSRIQAIQEFCELGAGFRIAARDLEIRGSGNFLGMQQSGHIAAVGFEYYLQLIENCIGELKGKQVKEEVEPVLNLKVAAYIPEDYIPDMVQRLPVYKRLSAFKNESELTALRSELEDRYGLLPAPVQHLLQIVTIKLLARALKIQRLDATGDGVLITFDPAHPLADTQVRRLLSESAVLIGGPVRSAFGGCSDLPAGRQVPPRPRAIPGQSPMAGFRIKLVSEFSVKLLLNDLARTDGPTLCLALKDYLQSLR